MALSIWQSALPADGTPVESYLASRGMTSPLPSSLRFHRGLKHPSGGTWPCMVALVTKGVDDKPLAIHRTFLAREGQAKAPVEPAKMMLGPCRGGAVRLAVAIAPRASRMAMSSASRLWSTGGGKASGTGSGSFHALRRSDRGGFSIPGNVSSSATVILCTVRCFTWNRSRIRVATGNDTIVTDAVSGRPARAARSRYAEEMERSREPLPGFLQMYALSGPILEAADDDDASFHLYGQAAALTKEVGAGELVEHLVDETRAIFAGLRTR